MNAAPHESRRKVSPMQFHGRHEQRRGCSPPQAEFGLLSVVLACIHKLSDSDLINVRLVQTRSLIQ
jgi:hypothetical protein